MDILYNPLIYIAKFMLFHESAYNTNKFVRLIVLNIQNYRDKRQGEDRDTGQKNDF